MSNWTKFFGKWPRFAYLCLHAVSGVYAGACLSIALVDVPSIHALGDGARALASFQLVLPTMGRLMFPQLVLMTVLMLLLAKRNNGIFPRTLIPLAVLLSILLVTAVVHIPLNRRFLAGNVAIAEVLPLIRQWLAFHWLRTLLALALPYCVARFLRKAGNAHGLAEAAAFGEVRPRGW